MLNDAHQPANQSWSPLKKTAFRFSFIYIILYVFFNNNGAFFFIGPIVHYPSKLIRMFVPWFAEHIIHYKYDYTIFSNGSGDTSYDYVLILCMILAALTGCIIWSVLDRKRTNYDVLYYWLLVTVRFYLGFTLMLYGSVKLIKLQFPDPSLYRLLQPYGNSSPMGLAWTFLGFSTGYNIFMGLVEFAAALLLFRKTMVVGAFLALAASAHVMSMNYFYDVPVKLLSTMLVLLALFILAPNFVRLYRFFLQREPQQLKQVAAPSYKKKWQRNTVYSIKYLVILLTLTGLYLHTVPMMKVYGSAAPKPPLYGIYNVQQFVLKGKELLPLTTDTTRWEQVIFDRPEYARVKLMNDSLINFNVSVDQKNKEISFTTSSGTTPNLKFRYILKGKDQLFFTGLRDNKDSLSIRFKRKDLKEFKLINRGFHWVNEYPYNR
jgi:hypothetical protein